LIEISKSLHHSLFVSASVMIEEDVKARSLAEMLRTN
jgi:hypothetical protein